VPLAALFVVGSYFQTISRVGSYLKFKVRLSSLGFDFDFLTIIVPDFVVILKYAS